MDVQTVIDQLGGRHALQTLLGVGPSAISNYITRGCFPRRVRTIIEAALHAQPAHNSANNQGIPITPSALIRPVHGKLIIGGGIAAYKALELTRRM